jgi:hypothetical protein
MALPCEKPMRVVIFALVVLFAFGCIQSGEPSPISPSPEPPVPSDTGCDWRPAQDYGACEMILGAYYNGQQCEWLSGCSVDEEIPFESIVQCQSMCEGPPPPESPMEVPNGQGITASQCEAAGGLWNECGSACRGAPEGTPCIAVCVAYCECGGFAGFSCPENYECTDYLPEYAADALGVCSPIHTTP